MERQTAGELEACLAETQRSLAVALARVEAYRCREQILIRDYQDLLARAQDTTVHHTKQSPKPSECGDVSATTSPLQQAADAASDVASCAPTHLALSSLNEQHPIWLNTSHGRVPGTLLVAGNSLHFVETHARIGPGEYLGLRALKPEALESARSSRLDGAASMRNPSGGAESPTSGTRGQDAGAAGVLSGAANWLAQKVRVSGNGGVSASGEDSAKGSSAGLGFSNIMETIMHSLDDDSSDDTGEARSEASLRRRSSRASLPPPPPAAAAASISPSAPPVLSRTPYTGPAEAPGLRPWDIAWADSYGHMRRLQFEADLPTRAFIHAQVQTWAAASSAQGSHAGLAASAYEAAKPVSVCDGCKAAISAARLPAKLSEDGRLVGVRVLGAMDLELAMPEAMRPIELDPQMEGNSGLPGIIGQGEARALAGALPSRHRLSTWSLLYSTERHGISLQTLYRKSIAGPSFLIVRDTNGYVFGAFTSDGWRLSSHFFGTGETFVFQLRPHQLAWRWKRTSADMTRNDYFMFGAPDSIAVGGGGHFALFLQGNLLRGSSGISATFGNACLASANEFTVGQVELWALNRT